MAEEPFFSYAPNLTTPLDHIQEVTPADGTDLALPNGDPLVSRAIYVGVSGDVSVVTNGGEIVTVPALAAGIWHGMRVKRVRATGTTATGIRVGW